MSKKKHLSLNFRSFKRLLIGSLSASLIMTAAGVATGHEGDHSHDEHSHNEHSHNEHSHDHQHQEHQHHDHQHHDQAHDLQHHDHHHSHHQGSGTKPEGYASKRRPNMVIPDSIRKKTEIAISNYPLFLLSEAVTQGAPSGKLLLQPGDVGHHGSLSPSDMKTVKDSRYVVWFGDELESNLANSVGASSNNISLFQFKAFNRRPLRDVKGQPIAGTLDPHIWLDPENAKAITRALGVLYSRANPKYKAVYAANVRNFEKQMDQAVAQVRKSPAATRPYWAYHDAYGYLEPTLNLKLAGALTADHHLPPKASQFHWLNKTRPQPTMCMVLQSDSNKGALTKLKPVNSTVQQEDMSSASDFISAWTALAKQVNSCVN